MNTALCSHLLLEEYSTTSFWRMHKIADRGPILSLLYWLHKTFWFLSTPMHFSAFWQGTYYGFCWFQKATVLKSSTVQLLMLLERHFASGFWLLFVLWQKAAVCNLVHFFMVFKNTCCILVLFFAQFWWAHRVKSSTYQNYYAPVERLDFKMLKPKQFDIMWISQECNGPAVTSEVCVSGRNSNIVWVGWPLPAGS